MARAGKSLNYLLVLSIVFLLLPVSVMCNDVEELNQGLMKDNLTISYNFTFPYLIASFGGPLVQGVEYHVSVAYPKRRACCDPIDPPPIKDHLKAQFWIVVIQRRGCLFVQKVRNAQNAGFDAAIIHNIGSNDLVRMGREDGDGAEDILIPAFFIGQDDGVNLTNEYFQARIQGQTLLLSMETNGFEPNNARIQRPTPLLSTETKGFETNYDYITHLVLLPCYAAIAMVFGLVIYLLVHLVKNCSIRRPTKRFASLGTLSNSLATIPTKKFEIGDPYETCAVCFKDYCKGDKLRVLHCSHAFHCKCIDQWLANHRRICPLCNQPVESQQTSVDVV